MIFVYCFEYIYFTLLNNNLIIISCYFWFQELFMNICFLIFKIISKIKFDFVINNNSNLEKEKISIVRFKVYLIDETEIKVIGYNKIADWCYQKLALEDDVFIKGFLSNEKVEIENIGLL